MTIDLARLSDADGSQALELHDEGASGYRHYLNEIPVYAGMVLELQIDGGGQWLRGRYEWRFDPEALPTFHVAIATANGDHSTVVFSLPPQALLRWSAPEGRAYEGAAERTTT